MKRLVCLDLAEARKIRGRQLRGSMTELYDEEDYLCYDEEELKNWSPKKRGRKVKRES